MTTTCVEHIPQDHGHDGLRLIHIRCRVCLKLLGYRLPLRRIPLGSVQTNIKVFKTKRRRK